MLKKLFLCLIMASLGSSAWAADISTWSSADIYGGQIWSLAINPHDPNVLLAGGIKHLYKSTDGAATWQPAGVSGLITGIAFAPSNSSTVYVCAGGSNGEPGIYKSLDCGQTWSWITTSIPLNRIACDPADEHRVYASQRQVNPGQIYESTDGGLQWHSLFTLPADHEVSRLAKAGSRLIATTQVNYDGDGAIFVGQNAGDHWDWNSFAGAYFSLANCPVYSLAVDPGNSQNIFVGGRSYIFKSTDGGGSWAKVDVSSTLGEQGMRTTMMTDPGGNTLLAFNEIYFYKSTDGGGNWNKVGPIDPSAGGPLAGLCDPVSDGVNVYLADSNGYGVYKSTDGAVFQPANNNIKGVRFLFLTRNPLESDVFYAGSDVDFYRTRDGGQTWTQLTGMGGLRAGLGDMIVTPLSASSVIACQQITGSAQEAIVRSDDYGGNWQLMSLLPENAGGVLKFVFAPGNTTVVYAGVGSGIMSPRSNDGLYLSQDGGRTWNMTAVSYFGGSVISNFAIDPGNTLTMYAGKGQFCQQLSALTTGAYRSIDGGATWTQMGGVPSDIIIALLLDPDNPAVLYAATKSNGLYRSADRGETWSRIHSQYGISALVITQTAGNEPALCFSTDSGSVYVSADEGLNWQLYSSGFDVINVLCPGSLYAGTDSGLYKTEITLSANPSPTPDSGNNPAVAVSAYPNPGSRQINFRIQLQQPAPVKLELYNIAGERVALLGGNLAPGDLLAWDTQKIGPGIYLARVSVNGKIAAKLKVAVVRK